MLANHAAGARAPVFPSPRCVYVVTFPNIYELCLAATLWTKI